MVKMSVKMIKTWKRDIKIGGYKLVGGCSSGTGMGHYPGRCCLGHFPRGSTIT